MPSEDLRGLPPNVLRLVERSLASMDHVELLLRLRAEPEAVLSASELARIVPGSRDRANECLADLERAGLAERVDHDYRYTADHDERRVVDELADTYRTRPVTLIRAIYGRSRGVRPRSHGE